MTTMVISLPNIREARTIDAIRALRPLAPTLLFAKRCIEEVVARGSAEIAITHNEHEIDAVIADLEKAGFRAEVRR